MGNSGGSLVTGDGSLSTARRSLIGFTRDLSKIERIGGSSIMTGALSDIGVLITCISVTVVTVLLKMSVFLVDGAMAANVAIEGRRVTVVGCVKTGSFMMESPFIVRNLVVKLFNTTVPLTLLCFLCSGTMMCVVRGFDVLGGVVAFLPIKGMCVCLLPVKLMVKVKVKFLKDCFAIHGRLEIW